MVFRQSEEVLASLQVLRARYADRRVLIGRDKLDAVKGIPQKLKAFDYFLQRYPEWIGKVSRRNSWHGEPHRCGLTDEVPY